MRTQGTHFAFLIYVLGGLIAMENLYSLSRDIMYDDVLSCRVFQINELS